MNTIILIHCNSFLNCKKNIDKTDKLPRPNITKYYPEISEPKSQKLNSNKMNKVSYELKQQYHEGLKVECNTDNI